MPYVGSHKTVPPAEDRVILDAVVRPLADEAANLITDNMSLVDVYQDIFLKVSKKLDRLLLGKSTSRLPRLIWDNTLEAQLAQAIYGLKQKYDYEGAHLGE